MRVECGDEVVWSNMRCVSVSVNAERSLLTSERTRPKTSIPIVVRPPAGRGLTSKRSPVVS
jgi:hypothetical protein